LIRNATHKEQFELMMKELESDLGKIWEAQSKHVIISIAEGCIKFRTRQKEFIKELMSSFHANQSQAIERQKLANIFLFNSPTIPENPMLDRFGCQLLAIMFKFEAQQIQVLLESFLLMDNKVFTDMCCHKFGSQVAETLVMSKPAVGNKLKYKIIKKLKGNYARLAKDLFGSRVIEKCMFVSEAKRKKDIAAELVADEKNMRNCKHGIIVWNKCYLSKFKQDAEQWLSLEEQNAKRREMFKEILEDKPESDTTEQEHKPESSSKVPKEKKGNADPLLASTKNKKSKFKLMDIDVFANVKAKNTEQGKKRAREEENALVQEESDSKLNKNGEEQESGVTDISFIAQAIKKLKKIK